VVDWLARAQELSPDIRDFVEGRWQARDQEAPLRKYSPRDGTLLYEFHPADPEGVDAAITAARRAVNDGRWHRKTLDQRKESLHRLASLLEANREDLALRECLDVGKPINDALNIDIPLASGIIRYNAEAIDKLQAAVYPADSSCLSYQLRRPVGVVAAIIGWNFPVVLAAQKVGPALAAGNSLVLKPSELTCLSVSRLAELAMEAGVPEGVLNVVHGGPAVGDRLARHKDVDLLTFTGSSQTGKKLLVAAGESNMKRLLLECGGKAPNLVFEDCPPLEAVADAVVGRAFWNQGEVCSASSRLLVQESIKDRLLDLVIERTQTLRPEDPLRAEARFGALVSEAHKRKVLAYIASAQADGAQVAFQGTLTAPVAAGFYVPPTILDRVQSHHRVAQEEIFGPVLSVMSFRDEEEAIRLANGTTYGLTATAWTQDAARALRMTQAICAGEVVVNATAEPRGGPGIGSVPVGGLKESGIGVEGGLAGVEAYTSHTAVQIFF
jgi:acyl-CoA reductase-like NAD-dependent aldehyde dehydrogenase